MINYSESPRTEEPKSIIVKKKKTHSISITVMNTNTITIIQNNKSTNERLTKCLHSTKSRRLQEKYFRPLSYLLVLKTHVYVCQTQNLKPKQKIEEQRP